MRQYISILLTVIALCLGSDGLAHSAFDGSAGLKSITSQPFSSGKRYDVGSRLTGKSGAWLEYDVDGNRKASYAGGASKNFLIDDRNPTGYGQVIVEFASGTSDALKVYAYGNDLISMRLPQQGPTGTVYYYGYDGHGSVRMLFDGANAEVEIYDYDAYGTIIAQTAATVENVYLYTGEQWDPDLGMYYLRARYYDESEGRFWTMDNFEGAQYDPASLHKYLYAHADPVNGIDPSGQMTLTAQLPTFVSISSLTSLSLPSLAGAKSAAFTLTLAIAAGASLSGSMEAAHEQAAIQAAELTLAGAGTSMGNELAKAEQI